MGAILEGPGFEVDGVKFELYSPEAPKDQEAEEEAPQLSWGELAELTHPKQVELFGFCTCEDGPKVWDDCTQDGS
jgi:hypothetical protein